MSVMDGVRELQSSSQREKSGKKKVNQVENGQAKLGKLMRAL